MPSLEDERDRLRVVSEKRRRADGDRCGTVAGYFVHRRKTPKEFPCYKCRAAWAARAKRKRREAKARKKEQV